MSLFIAREEKEGDVSCIRTTLAVLVTFQNYIKHPIVLVRKNTVK